MGYLPCHISYLTSLGMNKNPEWLGVHSGLKNTNQTGIQILVFFIKTVYQHRAIDYLLIHKYLLSVP